MTPMRSTPCRVAVLAVACLCLAALSCGGGDTAERTEQRTGGAGGTERGERTGRGGGKGGAGGAHRQHGEQKAEGRQQEPLPDVPQGEVRYTFISTAGKSPAEAAVLPLRYYEVFFPVMPKPPQTDASYDERLAFRDLAIQMVEKKNVRFLNALHTAADGLDYKQEWQKNYEDFIAAGHKEGGWLAQLESARKDGNPCPANACGSGAPPADGCPHTHPGAAQWAPDGSLLAVFRTMGGKDNEGDADTLMLDFGCEKH